ncbi:hypothetical protein HGM15179_017544 [Zosterops borbonicus]|uniref:Uncharacterized protein n=1 Tax=Zosterops borbonicus TaxID=364589 RepID=A0A8K1G0R3_9PASS|nr:hypothetical protein HGM15179_017544 [Zosterops borbonicus]
MSYMAPDSFQIQSSLSYVEIHGEKSICIRADTEGGGALAQVPREAEDVPGSLGVSKAMLDVAHSTLG